MASWFSSLTPEKSQKLNLVADCVVIAIAAVASTITDASPGINYVVASGLAFGAILVWAICGRLLRHYDVWNGRGIKNDLVLTGLLIASLAAILALLRHVVPTYANATELSRFFVVLVPGVLWVRGWATWARYRRNLEPENVLIVGVGPLGRLTGLDIRDSKRHKVLGYLRFADEPSHDRLPAGILGTAADLENMLKEHVVAEVYIAGNGGSHRDEMQAAVESCERFGIPFALPACGFRMARARPEHAKAVTDGYLHYQSVQHKPVQLAMKRAFDVFASGLALLLLSPLLIGVAVGIKLTSRGPVLFRQVRVGRQGQTFHMLKFRSMVVNAEEIKAKLMSKNEQSGPVFKMTNDPRVTAIGRFIRKFSIDELPQLLNVLRGEMTIVGPRPPIPSEVARYEAWQRRRLSVRPGLTCVWQVSGRNAISFEEWMYLDMQYIDHWSLKQDFSLILKTIPVVVTGRGAS